MTRFLTILLLLWLTDAQEGFSGTWVLQSGTQTLRLREAPNGLEINGRFVALGQTRGTHPGSTHHFTTTLTRTATSYQMHTTSVAGELRADGMIVPHFHDEDVRYSLEADGQTLEESVESRWDHPPGGHRVRNLYKRGR